MQQGGVGFDRKIRLEWLDATADWAAEGLPIPEIRARLAWLLQGQVAGEGPHSARGKTITVLVRVWALVPPDLKPLRDEGLNFLRRRAGRDRLPLHWGMCLATYPFFRDVATIVGRLLVLQGTVAASQITRRVAETWGERSTIARAVPRVLGSLVLWGALAQAGPRGVYAGTTKILVGSQKDETGPWLAEAALSGCRRPSHSLRGLVASPALFPFALDLRAPDLLRSPRLEIHRQGLDEDLVLRKGGR